MSLLRNLADGLRWLFRKERIDGDLDEELRGFLDMAAQELLDVADVIRSHPEVINYLQHIKDNRCLDELVQFDGGQESRDAIYTYLNKYGTRCPGEIDITEPRWSEKPTTVVPMILGNIKNFEPNASHLKFEQGRQEALNKEQELLERLK